MKFCESCRVQNKLRRPGTYPYHDHGPGQCQICRRQKDCYDYPELLIKQKKDLTLEEKKLDKRIQEEYHQKCDEMIIAYSTGKYAGGTDHQTSEQLRSTVVQIDNEIDWYATYQIRKKIQQGYDKKRR